MNEVKIPEPVKQAIKLANKYIEMTEKKSPVIDIAKNTINLVINPMFYVVIVFVIVITAIIFYKIGRQRAIDDIKFILNQR